MDLGIVKFSDAAGGEGIVPLIDILRSANAWAIPPTRAHTVTIRAGIDTECGHIQSILNLPCPAETLILDCTRSAKINEASTCHICPTHYSRLRRLELRDILAYPITVASAQQPHVGQARFRLSVLTVRFSTQSAMHPAASWLLSLWKYSVRELRFDGGSLAGRPTESADEETEHQPPLEDSDMIAGPFPPVPLYVSLHHFSLKEAVKMLQPWQNLPQCCVNVFVDRGYYEGSEAESGCLFGDLAGIGSLLPPPERFLILRLANELSIIDCPGEGRRLRLSVTSQGISQSAFTLWCVGPGKQAVPERTKGDVFKALSKFATAVLKARGTQIRHVRLKGPLAAVGDTYTWHEVFRRLPGVTQIFCVDTSTPSTNGPRMGVLPDIFFALRTPCAGGTLVCARLRTFSFWGPVGGRDAVHTARKAFTEREEKGAEKLELLHLALGASRLHWPPELIEQFEATVRPVASNLDFQVY